MIKTWFYQLIIILATAAWQQAFAPALSGILSYLNVLVLLIVFGLFFGEAKKILVLLFGLGFLMDLYSFFAFGTYLLFLLLLFVLAKFLFEHILTDRSLYSLYALVAALIVIWQSIELFLFQKQTISEGQIKFFLVLFLKSLAVNLFVATVVFYIIHYLAKHLTPVFIIKPERK